MTVAWQIGLGIATILGFACSAVALVYAIKTNREKQQLQEMMKAHLAYLAGNVTKIRTNAAWADDHMKDVQRCALKLPDSDEKNSILKHERDGARDVTAAERMIGNLLSEILAIQDGQFGSHEIRHADDSPKKSKSQEVAAEG